MNHPYLGPLISKFQNNYNAENARGAEKYMRDQFKFLGIKSPGRRELSKQFYAQHGLPEIRDLDKIIKDLWSLEHREYQYFGMELCDKFKKKFRKNDIKLMEWMVTNKSWWDTVDYIAANPIGNYFRLFPECISDITGRWIKHSDFWLNRSALLFQLKYKEQTDAHLLFEYCDQHKHQDEFFIRKAIGWALRQFAKTDPKAVKDYVKSANLKPLSKKEALKNL